MAYRKNNLFVPHCIIRDNYYYENSATSRWHGHVSRNFNWINSICNLV